MDVYPWTHEVFDRVLLRSIRVDLHMIIYGRAGYRAYEKLFSKMKNLSGW